MIKIFKQNTLVVIQGDVRYLVAGHDLKMYVNDETIIIRDYVFNRELCNVHYTQIQDMNGDVFLSLESCINYLASFLYE